MDETLRHAGELERECRVYCRYLLGRSPDEYVLQKYQAFHAHERAAVVQTADRFDRLLLSASLCCPFSARLVDTYANHFFKRSVVRKKLVLLLAILECSPATYRLIDSTDRGGRLRVIGVLSVRSLLYAVLWLVAIVGFGPLHAMASLGVFRKEAG
jgi:hypothetical protein